MVKLSLFLLVALGCTAATSAQHIIRRERPAKASQPKETLLTTGSEADIEERAYLKMVGNGDVSTRSKPQSGDISKKSTAPKTPLLPNGMGISTSGAGASVYVKDSDGNYHEQVVGGTSSLTEHKSSDGHKPDLSEADIEERAYLKMVGNGDVSTRSRQSRGDISKKSTAPKTPLLPNGMGTSTSGAGTSVYVKDSDGNYHEQVVGGTSSLTEHKSSDGHKPDLALNEAKTDKVMYVLDKQSARFDQVNSARLERAKKWREAANPVEVYDGPVGSKSFTEMSKRISKKGKSYDGMQAVASGFWADDRPNERRVDMSDHKIYTWRQYRLKYPSKHSWSVESMWKKLPTEKRVKKMGKRAFIQRFR